MSPRRIVLAYALCSVVAQLLAVSGVTRLPPRGYFIADLVLEAAIILGLWLLWRPVWLFAVVLGVLGGLFVALHPIRNAVLLLIGTVQLALLLLPPLRQAVRPPPFTSNN
jgi:hypothetical protein